MKRSDKLSNFRMDPSGKYVYTGAYVKWQKSEEEYRQVLSRKICYVSAFLGLQTILGCKKNSGMDGNPFVILPYAANIILALVMAFTLIYSVKTGKTKKVYEYEETVLRMERLSAAGIVITTLCLVGFFASGWFLGFCTFFYPVFQGISLVLCTLGKRFCKSETEFWQKN